MKFFRKPGKILFSLFLVLALMMAYHDWVLIHLRHATENACLRRVCDRHLGTCEKGIRLLFSRLRPMVGRRHWARAGFPWGEKVLLESSDPHVDAILLETAKIPLDPNHSNYRQIFAMRLLWLRSRDVLWLGEMHRMGLVMHSASHLNSDFQVCLAYCYQCVANAKMLQCASIPGYIVEHFGLVDISNPRLAGMPHEEFMDYMDGLPCLLPALELSILLSDFSLICYSRSFDLNSYTPLRGMHPIACSRMTFELCCNGLPSWPQ